MGAAAWGLNLSGLLVAAAVAGFVLRRQGRRERAAAFAGLDARVGPPATPRGVRRWDPRRAGAVDTFALVFSAAALATLAPAGADGVPTVVGWLVAVTLPAAGAVDLWRAARAPSADRWGPPALVTAADRGTCGVTAAPVLAPPAGRPRNARRAGPVAGVIAFAAAAGGCGAAGLWPVAAAWAAGGLLTIAVLVRRVRRVPGRAAWWLTETAAVLPTGAVPWAGAVSVTAATVPAGPLAGGRAVRVVSGGREVRFLVTPAGAAALDRLLGGRPSPPRSPPPFPAARGRLRIAVRPTDGPPATRCPTTPPASSSTTPSPTAWNRSSRRSAPTAPRGR